MINPRTFEINKLYENKLKGYPINVKQQIDDLVQFVTDSFTKDVKSNHLDYIFSAYFANKIFHDLDNGTIEAIYYPSVKEKLTFENLAIKPDVFDKKYELFEVSDSIVTQYPSFGGGYFMEGLGSSKSFDFAAGKILWGDTIYQPHDRLRDLKRMFNFELN